MSHPNPPTLLCYMAHPYGGKPENLRRARAVLRHLNATHFPIRAFIAPWIDWCEAVPETPENRAAGLGLDCAEVARCDEMWLVGGHASAGMRVESDAARMVVNALHLTAESLE